MKKTFAWTKNGKRLGATFLSAGILTGMLVMGAGAVTQVTAQLTPALTIQVDGTARTFYTASGTEAHPIIYNGTTYLPLRAIGELMGKNVNWDQSTLTVSIEGSRTGSAVTGTPDTTTAQQNIAAQVRDDFTIQVDQVTRTFRDANGNVVYPLLYNGSTYLPVRAIGELMGKTVGWDAANQTVILEGNQGGSLVTDADSFEDGQTTTGIGYISVETAKAKALAHAGLSAGQVTFVQQKLDWENGRRVYEIEFYTADFKEYDYEIDATTGNVISFDYDADYYTPSTGGTTTGLISVETAKEKALAHAGLSASQVTFVQQKLDWDDGRQVYDIEFYTKDYKEYDYEIDAKTGSVIGFDYDADHYAPPSTGAGISLEKAKTIALAKVPGATTANITKAKADYDDGRLEYDVEIVYGTTEYEFEIDGSTGTILSMDRDSIYD